MPRSADRPVLITDVGDSPQEEYLRRRRRYSAMMGGRVLCIIAAFIVGSIYHNIWLSLLLIAAAAVLPWAAVLIANDRLPKAERLRMAEARRKAAGTGAVTLTALPRTGSEPMSDATTGDRPQAPPRIIEG